MMMYINRTLKNPALFEMHADCFVILWPHHTQKNLLRIGLRTQLSCFFDSAFASSYAWLKEVDWEVELAFVIGRRGKHIKVSITSVGHETLTLWWSIHSDSISTPVVVQEEDALSYVAGFTVANDVSARDWLTQRNGKQWLLGKTFDNFCPLGPALVTTDAVKGKREWAATAGGATQKEGIKDNLVIHAIICDLCVSSITELTSCNYVKSEVSLAEWRRRAATTIWQR